MRSLVERLIRQGRAVLLEEGRDALLTQNCNNKSLCFFVFDPSAFF